MQVEFENEWPDKLRDALTSDLVSMVISLNNVDYLVDEYDAVRDEYHVRRTNRDGEVFPAVATETVSFVHLASIQVY